MSNDNKTLAEAQPGGRVRLGDQALSTSEGARRYVADFFATQLRRHDFGDYILTKLAADFACALAQYLSAQPSPGGQDALAYEGHSWVSDYVLAGLRERAAMPLQLRNGEVWHWQGDGHDFPESLICPVVMSAETLRALLAARQPVAGLSWADYWMESGRPDVAQDFDAFSRAEAWALQRFPAAHQPVGEQRAALWIQFAENGNIRFWTKDQDRALAESFLHARPLTAFYASPQQPAQAVDLGPRPMETAPRDGTMVRLLVQFEENPTEDSFEPAWTIGACNDDNVGEDERVGWKFAGWCWEHDHFTEGKGAPVGWLPLLDSHAVGK